jgi:hypothetical protein
MVTTWATVRLVIDDKTIESDDPTVVIDPVWWSVSIYDGLLAYERAMEKFTDAQRFVFAVLWYAGEVNNGGHSQFYSNSTGIVWRDAADGLAEMGLDEFHDIIRQSAKRLGGSPPFDQDEREELLDTLRPDFKDLDDRFYAADRAVDLTDKLMDFIRSRRTDFYFSGNVQKPIRG